MKISLGRLSFGVEDLLFSFAFAGICIGLFCQQLALAGATGGFGRIRERFAGRFFTIWPGICTFWVLAHFHRNTHTPSTRSTPSP